MSFKVSEKKATSEPATKKDIKNKITSRTKAIIAVHLYGQPCNMDEINKIAELQAVYGSGMLNETKDIEAKRHQFTA